MMMMTQKTLFPAAAAAMLLLFLPSQTMAFDYCCKNPSCLSAEFNTDQCTSRSALVGIANGIKNNFENQGACESFSLDSSTDPSLGDTVLTGRFCAGAPAKCCLVDESDPDTCDSAAVTCFDIGFAPTPEEVCEETFRQTTCVASSFNYCCKDACTNIQKSTPGQCIPLSAPSVSVEIIAASMTGTFENAGSCDGATVIGLPSGSALTTCPTGGDGSCCAVEDDDCDDGVLNGGASCLSLGERVTPAEACDFIGLKQCTFCDEGAGCNMDPHFVTWPNTKKGGDRTKFDCTYIHQSDCF